MGPYKFSVKEGRLPPGIKLKKGGKLRGTPTRRGTFQFTVQAEDVRGFAAQQTFQLKIK
jgi:hypothetical protein